MDAVSGGCRGGWYTVAVLGLCRASVFAGLALGGIAHAAQEQAQAQPQEPGEAVTVARADTARPQFEVSTSSIPHFDSASDATHSLRVDLTLFPQSQWQSRSGLGFSVGVGSPRAGAPSLRGPYAFSPSVDLGLHWRYVMDRNYRLDVTAWRRAPVADAISLIESQEPSYGARVEMGFASGKQPARRGFVADRGFVGFQLEGGGRVTVKRSGGRPMLYYRNTF